MSNQSPHQPDDHGSGRWQRNTDEPTSPGTLPPNLPAQAAQPVLNRWQQPETQWPQPTAATPQVQPQYSQAVQQAPAPAPYQQGVPARYDMTAPRKSKTIALILALPFLPTSWLGIHNFYLGQTLRGVLHLVFALLGMVPLLWFVVDPVHFIFIVVELVLIITGAGNYGTDKQGRPLV